MSWALMKQITHRALAPLFPHTENTRALLVVGICLRLLGNPGRGMLRSKKKLSRHGFCHNRRVFTFLLLKPSNKQDRQEGTDFPLACICLSFASCLPDPTPGVSGCSSSRQGHTSPESLELGSLMERMFVERKPECS